MLYPKQKRILETLHQIKEAIFLLQKWNQEVTKVDDYLLSPDGMKNLAASCMLIESIGEGFKKNRQGYKLTAIIFMAINSLEGCKRNERPNCTWIFQH